jgi:hypothetical protein
MGFPLTVLIVFFAVQIFRPRAKSSTTHTCNHWLCCGEMMAGAMDVKMSAMI